MVATEPTEVLELATDALARLKRRFPLAGARLARNLARAVAYIIVLSVQRLPLRT